MRSEIDRDSPPRRSDLEVLGRHRFVSRRKSRWPPELRFVKVFEQTFQPSDGIGRCYFRGCFDFDGGR